jgi:hypothetical protein
MKDSTLNKLQGELTSMVDLLKSYVHNLLQDDPSERTNRQINKKAKKKISKAYDQLADLFWNVFTSLQPEQKQAIRKALEGPAAGKDFINTLSNSFNETLSPPPPTPAGVR